MKYTIITHFNSEGYRNLYSALDAVSEERICRVPYGRVENQMRYQVDTLPYHLTVSSSTESLPQIMTKLEGFQFAAFDVVIIGLDVMCGKENSQVLYFKVAPSYEMELLQMNMFERIGNVKYMPNKNPMHLTICISKDFHKVDRVRTQIATAFSPFKLTIISLGLYEIWPGKLMAEYPLKMK